MSELGSGIVRCHRSKRAVDGINEGPPIIPILFCKQDRPMISLQRRSLFDNVLRLFPSYRRRQDGALREAIRLLMENTSAPCVIGDVLISDDLGSAPFLHSR